MGLNWFIGAIVLMLAVTSLTAFHMDKLIKPINLFFEVVSWPFVTVLSWVFRSFVTVLSWAS
jgi:hypothetical protein